MSALALLLTVSGAVAGAPPDVRVAVVIGSDEGDEGDVPLEYAEADARRFHQFLIEAGQVAPERAYLVTHGGAEAVRRALSEAQGRVAELTSRGNTALILYVSAHADDEAIHLAGTRLPLEVVRQALADSPATLRLAVIDACRTRAPSRSKGGRPGPEVRVSLTRPEKVEGAVLMTASGEGEPAQEWTYLRGSLFTHHLLAGLRGLADVNQDGMVSLAESYSYAFGRTVVQSAASQAGPQRPSFEMNVSGWGEWAFSRPDTLGARLVLGRGLAGKVWVADQHQDLVAELSKSTGETLQLAVRPGWYRVVNPDGQFAGVADVNLVWGGSRTIEADDLVRLPLERARLRGQEPVVLRPWRVWAGYGVGLGRVEGQGAQQSFELAVGRGWGPWLVRARLGGGWSDFRGQALSIAHRELQLSVGGGSLVPVWRLLAGGGLELHITQAWQLVHRDDEALLVERFGRGEPIRTGSLWGASAFGQVSVPLGDRLSVALEGSVGLMRVPLTTGAEWVPWAQARLGVGAAF